MFENYDEFGLELGGKYFSKNIKILNETNKAIWESYWTSGKYMPFNMQVKELLAKNMPIDEIGLQYHVFARAENLSGQLNMHKFLDSQNMLEILDLILFPAIGVEMK